MRLSNGYCINRAIILYSKNSNIVSIEKREREGEGGDPPAEVYGWFIQSDKQLDLYSGIGFGVGLKIV